MRSFTLASATLIRFSLECLFLFFVFMSTILKKDCSQRYVVTNGMSISRAFLAIRYNLVSPKCWECCSEKLLLNLALLKFNDVVEVLIIDICCCNTKRERLAVSLMLDMTLWWGSIHRAHLSAWQLLASDPRVQKCLRFQTHLLSYLHSCPAGESLRSYHSPFIILCLSFP